MRFVVGTGAYSESGAIDPIVVVDTRDPGGAITQVWPYDGADEFHVQHAAHLLGQCREMPDLTLGQFARLVAGGSILMEWDDFDADVLIHPRGPWE
ncbi:MAG: hypothetical protein OSB43_16910 [Nocardioides sp.]|uniref:hypothetical protein n=1 Tax=Nocardioides sp. TaxID=35761 RepID=UPI00239455E6|nr:hypothetical protein [Nocardioides sp.]MDE0777959.1 hypothetical protein [Nocardioides sp.]